MSHDYITFLAIGSVLTPYHNEETMYAGNEIDKKNEDGVSILFYLQKIYPGLSYSSIHRYLNYCSFSFIAFVLE